MMQKAGENINIQSASQKLKSSIKHPVSFVLFVLIAISVIFTVVSLGFLIGYILINGIPNLTPKLFAWHYTTENASMLPALINTIWMTILALVIAIPFGIGAAIYMVEYAKKGNKIVEIVRITAETLTGIPSIVYGLFGMLFFVTTCKMGLSLLAGALTLSIMVLPVIMRTTEEALLASAGFFSRRKFWTWGRKIANRIPHRSSTGDTGNFFRNYPGDGTNRRRDRSVDLHCRNRSRDAEKYIFIDTNTGGSHVFTFQ